MDFVEAEADVEWWRATFCVHRRKISEELRGTFRQLPHAAFQEIPGERRLGGDDQVGRLIPGPQLAKNLAQPSQVLAVGALGGAELGNGEAEHWWVI